MKKLVLAAALVFGGFATQAATIIDSNENVVIAVNQEEFTEISADEVPSAITEALERDYAGASIDKAYKNEAKEYKLEISMGEQSGVLYANENGEWIQK
ncbi:hypothetical protein SAMN02927921_01231 [Sinomicrobium oceani]|uniref:Beta-lactamase-inhibitor-like, PepSY-like n=1 Tax=Sinomicrobium oceani TaxID=1150368 RepID=A0A1K1NF80_9FLAO|nr:hypothetical protein [Sinomicrobium oceani]SFW33972.1 hypothetical protein SAMN02927921_01231 [Sinomicrobium oceani]